MNGITKVEAVSGVQIHRLVEPIAKPMAAPCRVSVIEAHSRRNRSWIAVAAKRPKTLRPAGLHLGAADLADAADMASAVARAPQRFPVYREERTE
ncbi:hypothetical protein QSJ18_08620 [Gordonia sp. ABSL1-1]|uniref:hypothetical protein n=1 Tax=Gordonia sp. ABSL1-1 TaxID=3053923 RepID=UPI0025747A78|nr:hypothetical protein [Gordonia sp. ABSL1-1]MDL9936801.1 hypothetical protein [Gordonia sp. ABSL1-1]